MARDQNAQLRNLIAGYNDSIRLSDIKAMIAVLFVAIMVGTVLQFRDRYPWYLKAPVLLIPFMIIFLNLLISVYPRFPRAGRRRFPLWRNPDPDDFDFVADSDAETAELPVRCALLSRILWWKNFTLRLAYLVSMACLVATAILLFAARV
jgi:hypothetical protein